jgi:hypothetical protein
MIRGEGSPGGHRSCEEPPGTLMLASVPFRATLLSFSGFTNVHRLVFSDVLLKSSEVTTVLPVPIVVGSEALSLEVLVSPPPETVAVLVTLAGGFPATFTLSVIAG